MWTSPSPSLPSVGLRSSGGLVEEPLSDACSWCTKTKEVSYHYSPKLLLIQCGTEVGNLPTLMCQIVIFFPKLEFKNAGGNFAGSNRRCLSKRQHAANQLIGSILPLCEAGARGSQGIWISLRDTSCTGLSVCRSKSALWYWCHKWPVPNFYPKNGSRIWSHRPTWALILAQRQRTKRK